MTLFSPVLKLGSFYRVKFLGKHDETVMGYTSLRRDIADGTMKPHLVVRAPDDLALGPTSIKVKDHRDKTILEISEDDFTMLQEPIELSESNGETKATCYRAAVGSDGTVYLPLDVSDISERMIFSGVGYGYPLLFGASDVTIYNTQGFLMQLLGPAQESIYEITDGGTADSFELTYDRHEFVSYQEAHELIPGLGVDPLDPVWHLDGTPHIDHDHLVLALHGELEGGGTPEPGKTPTFDFSIVTTLADAPSRRSKTKVFKWSNECSSSRWR
ncbi:MAG: hypothetical protein FJ144_10615 [Deltaproteobacteria bacterium]|nr:hypothetical protein [Deltaproteobacteria bacterium]